MNGISQQRITSARETYLANLKREIAEHRYDESVIGEDKVVDQVPKDVNREDEEPERWDGLS